MEAIVRMVFLVPAWIDNDAVADFLQQKFSHPHMPISSTLDRTGKKEERQVPIFIQVRFRFRQNQVHVFCPPFDRSQTLLIVAGPTRTRQALR